MSPKFKRQNLFFLQEVFFYQDGDLVLLKMIILVYKYKIVNGYYSLNNCIVFLDNSAPISDIFYAFRISEACLGKRPLRNSKVRDW